LQAGPVIVVAVIIALKHFHALAAVFDRALAVYFRPKTSIIFALIAINAITIKPLTAYRTSAARQSSDLTPVCPTVFWFLPKWLE
jgi:hypothetical protein